MENHHFNGKNPLFLWPCSIAMLVYQRVILNLKLSFLGRRLDKKTQQKCTEVWFVALSKNEKCKPIHGALIRKTRTINHWMWAYFVGQSHMAGWAKTDTIWYDHFWWGSIHWFPDRYVCAFVYWMILDGTILELCLFTFIMICFLIFLFWVWNEMNWWGWSGTMGDVSRCHWYSPEN